MNNYFLGNESTLGGTSKYFYGLRRNDDGDLYFARVNNLSTTDVATINKSGDVTDNYENFSFDEDFFEGRDANHNLVYPNLNYEQMKWDNRNLFYYLNDNGELVVRIGQTYQYNTADNV